MREFQPTEIEQQIAYRLKDFFSQENAHDYDRTVEQISKIGFIYVKLVGDKIHMCVKRPGLLIGAKGRLIHKLHEFLLEYGKIEIVEAFDWESMVIPYNPADFDY